MEKEELRQLFGEMKPEEIRRQRAHDLYAMLTPIVDDFISNEGLEKGLKSFNQFLALCFSAMCVRAYTRSMEDE